MTQSPGEAGPVIVLFGPPGSGKGTQAAELERSLGVVRVSIGEMLRRQIASDTPVGRQIAAQVARGEPAPDEVVADLVAHRLHALRCEAVVLDGYPRSADQAATLDAMRHVRAVAELQVPAGTAVRRSLERAREDDRPEVVLYRLEQYFATKDETLAAMRARGTVHLRVSGAGAVDDVAASLYRLLERFVEPPATRGAHRFGLSGDGYPS